MSDNREVQAPTLERALGLSGVLIIGIAWVTPLIVLATIGIFALRTPVVSITLIGIAGLGALFLAVTTSTSFINFGAFSAFTLVNLSVIAYFLRHRPQDGVRGILGWVAIPIAGAAIDFYLVLNLGGRAKLIGVAWLALGVVWLAWLTRGFRQSPPQLSIDKGVATSDEQ